MLPKRVYAEINLDAICDNVRNAMSKVKSGTKIMAVIKTNAYGHGSVPVAKALAEIGVYAFGVATIGEALVLRKNGIQNPILILSHVFSEDYTELLENDIMPTVFRYETAKKLSETAKALGKIAKIHIKIDTGMGRIGFQPTDEAVESIIEISKLPNISIDGIFTHFACADEKDKTSFNEQKARFTDFLNKLDENGIKIPIKHMCNSAGIIDFDGDFLNMARSGIMTYGLYPSDEVKKDSLILRPAMSIISHVEFVKTVQKGFKVSYGSTYTTDSETQIATIPIGYGDGYPRSLSNKGRVIINGQYANIIGRVCMDQLMVDVTGLYVKEGDKVTVIGTDGNCTITAEDVAYNAGSFNYEFLCGINMRVPRVYVKNGEITETDDYLTRLY